MIDFEYCYHELMKSSDESELEKKAIETNSPSKTAYCKSITSLVKDNPSKRLLPCFNDEALNETIDELVAFLYL
jgi:hypothetical protein